MTLHSALGASSAERWMNCPGSVELLKQLQLPESDEEDWRAEGIAAHEAAAVCLREQLEPWELIGTSFHGVTVDAEMAKALTVYTNACDMLRQPGFTYIEHPVRMSQHALGFGTCDFGAYNEAEGLLDITDLKWGVGIFVEVERNPQIMYYGFCKLQEHPGARRVRLRIIQPRITWADAIREWEISAEELAEWGETVLIPAMERTSIDNTLDTGSWCRFCPAKLICPVLTGLYGAAAKADPKTIVNLTDDQFGRDYQQRSAVKFYLKAQEAEAMRRLKLRLVPGIKLIRQKANRVWKPEARDILKARFGLDAYEDPELKSPAQMETLSPDAAEVVKRYAYTPEAGVTVALASDKAPAVTVPSAAETFAKALDNLQATAQSSE